VIAGNPKTHYGSEMINLQGFETFKDYVMSLHPYDLNRFHFLNWISEPALVDLYRLSDCHFYWTVPFTLSWSLFQALSTGCLVMGSNSAPVRDAITHGVNGLLVEPYDRDALVEQMLEILDKPEQYAYLRDHAREGTTQYSFETCLPKLADFYLGNTQPSTNGSNQSLTMMGC
jgi:glycosyltransferase involved in cell wall biosynthesis